jgi:hypothetical protein
LYLALFFSPYGCRAIQKSNCYHKEGHEAACSFGDTSYMLLFGVVQIVLSQTPDFHNIEWLSILAAIMSFTYSSIGLGLGIAKVVGMLVNSLLYYLAHDGGLYTDKERKKKRGIINLVVFVFFFFFSHFVF